MAEFWMSYNPFTVETVLAVKIGVDWVPVSEESGLLWISRMRMQRWLKPAYGRSYFDELREVSGEDHVEIYFSGTKEDLCDLQKAAVSYMEKSRNVQVLIRGSGDTKNNSSAWKLEQLNKILKDARKSGYRKILPDGIWKYVDSSMVHPASVAVRVPLMEWSDKKYEIFSEEAWQMICFVFDCETLHQKAARCCLDDFSKTIDKIEDRFFDRERFLFIGCYQDWRSNWINDVRKVFMEYGIQDIELAVLSVSEMEMLDCVGMTNQSEQYYRVQNSILQFNERYAEQYRIRKLQRIIKQMLSEQGYERGPRLLRKVEEALRGNEQENGEFVSDATVKNAAAWLSNFMDRIDHLLDVDMGIEYLDGKGIHYGK